MDSQLHPASSSSRSGFKCTKPGCGRRYSRLEHLQRHQLNHNPKDVYHCDYPACKRIFVRRDLLARHRERHDNPARTGPLRQACNREDWVSYSTNQDTNDHPGSIVSITGPDARQSPRGSTSDTESGPPMSHAGIDLTTTNTQQNTGVPHEICGATGSQPLEWSGNSQSSANRLEDSPWPLGLQAQDVPGSFTGETAQANENDNSIPSAGAGFANWLFDEMEGLQAAPSSTVGLTNFSLFNDACLLDPTPEPFTFLIPQAVSSLVIQHQQDINEERVVAPAYIYNNSISLQRWQSLINLLTLTFTAGNNLSADQQYSYIFQGDIGREEHVLSLGSMRRYLNAYWSHFHSQLPFLHQATFSAETAHDYLLLGLIVIGATHVDDTKGTSHNCTIADMADFIAWHLRRQLFLHDDFESPAKLWLLQTLLLLETYEYLSSSRKLHERSYLHHSTIINLMRRGVAFNEAAIQRPRRYESLSEWWKQWIRAEETRRVALAVFMLDTLYATMFGHTAALTAHEIKLALPCNDILWAASSAAEVARLEATLQASCVKPTTLLEALRQTLLGQKVTTDHFGRIIVMSGLLSVAWQMKQRDVQIATFSAPPMAHTAADSWKLHLSEAYEFWKSEFDDSLEQRRMFSLPESEMAGSFGATALVDLAELLYRMSHMAMNVDLLDCEVFAGATRGLGQNVSRLDFAKVQSRISNWAETDNAKKSVFHALQLLKAAIPCPEAGVEHVYATSHGHLLFRPWTLYCAALVLWSYCVATKDSERINLASDGPQESTTEADIGRREKPSYAEVAVALRGAQAFLLVAGSITSLEHIDSEKIGSGNVAAPLEYLEFTFRSSPWELLRESADCLRLAVQVLKED